MAIRRRKRTPSQIYQLKITLRGIRPPIWRRVQVPGDISLGKLHRIIQAVMGWDDYHLHQFEVDRTYYGPPSPKDEFWGFEMKNEHLARLNRIAPREKDKFTYEYDFGDSWKHEILVEKILPPEEGVRYPRCIKGRRACPPEDCGGIWGYENLLEILRDPNHPEHESMLEWSGEFDPEEFDLEAANEALKFVR